MVVNEVKQKIVDSASPMQCGGLPGHMAAEHLFTMRSVIGQYRKNGKPFIIQLYDLKQFFDKEVLVDVMDVLYSSANVKGRDYRNIYNLSKDNKIRVRTGVGYSDYVDAGPLLGQGSGGAALYSQKYLDTRVGMMFEGSIDEMRYGCVRGSPVIFQDDIARGVASVDAANAGNVKMDTIVSQGQLSFHPDKTGYILMGSQVQIEEMREEIERKPIRCGDFITKEKMADKWLGMWLHSDGLSASVQKTVEERVSKVKGAMFEAVAVMEDFRSQTVSGFRTAIDLWELAIIPSLIHGSGVWTEISAETEKTLEDLQLFYLRLALKMGPGTPRVALRAQTGVLAMKYRIWIEKVMMIFHIRGLEEKAMAKKVWTEQWEQGWPGLAMEVSNICEVLAIPDINIIRMSDYSKKMIRNLTREACRSKDEECMRSEMDGLVKCDSIKIDEFKLQDYFVKLNLYESRDMFAIKCNMNKLRGNYRNGGQSKDLVCVGCKMNSEVNSHVMECREYEEERSGLDMSDDRGIVEYFRRVMDKRRKTMDRDKMDKRV